MSVKKMFAPMMKGVLALILLVAVCGAVPQASAQVNFPRKAFEFIAPSGAGGGWDLTIRTVAKTLQDNKLVKVPMPVTNKAGAGGGVTLAYMQDRKGSDTLLVVYSAPLLLINLTGTTPLSYKNTTPLARLIVDYGCFAVAKKSKFKTINDVMDALKKDPKSVKIGGTSAAGSLDHLQFLAMAKAAGVTRLREIDYISFQDATGAAMLMGGHIDLLSTGLGDISGVIESGDVIALATTAAERAGGEFANIPTCREQGIDADFGNWRGLFGAPGMPDYAVQFWRETLKKMVETKDWKAACVRNGWAEYYADKPEFEKYLEDTNEEYRFLLSEIGLLK